MIALTTDKKDSMRFYFVSDDTDRVECTANWVYDPVYSHISDRFGNLDCDFETIRIEMESWAAANDHICLYEEKAKE